MIPPQNEPWLVNLECLGTIAGPRFLDGRTPNGSVGLAPTTDPPFSGTYWALWTLFEQTLLLCLGHDPGPRVLCAFGPAGVSLLGDATGGTVDEVTGSQWSGVFTETADGTILTLQSPKGFLDGRTATRSVGLAPSTNPPFSGTRWRVHFLGRLVKLFFTAESQDYLLDGRTGDASVGLVVAAGFETEEAWKQEPFITGTLWAMLEQDGIVTLRCTGQFEGAAHARYLDGRTANGTVGLARSPNAPFTGARWQRVGLPDGTLALRCLGTIPGPRRFLDARTADKTVALAPSTDPPFIGTHWNVYVPLTIRGWWWFAPD